MTIMSTADLGDRLIAAFAWRGDRVDERSFADVTGWWRDPALLPKLGAALSGLVADETPTVVLGLPSRGVLLGALVARDLPRPSQRGPCSAAATFDFHHRSHSASS